MNSNVTLCIFLYNKNKNVTCIKCKKYLAKSIKMTLNLNINKVIIQMTVYNYYSCNSVDIVL